MSRRIVNVSDDVRRKARLQGADGERWLLDLGAVVAGLERDWSVTVGAPLGGGSDSYVAAARTAAGEEVVLKVALPGSAVHRQAATLRRAGGTGYVRLLRYDEDRRALLLERLGGSLADSGRPVRLQIEVICDTLLRAWEAPADPSLPTGAEKAHWLSAFIAATWEGLGRPCSERVVEQAHGFCAARAAAFDPRSAVLVHGDAHAANTLWAPRDGAYKLVDPDGLFAEPAYDLAIAMREWSLELLAGDTRRLAADRGAHLAALTGVDREPIWEWGFAERVSTGLLALQVGRERLGREMLAVAEAVAAS